MLADGAGRIVLEDISPGRFVARVEAYGFAPASLAVRIPDGIHTGVQVTLLPLGPPIAFDSELGATLDHGGVRVTIPPGALVDEDGAPVTGAVEATVVPLDPMSASLASLPGPLEGVRSGDGEIVLLESVFMAEVSLWKDGDRVDLAPGATAELELALPGALAGQYTMGDTIPAWWLDTEAGYWREEGLGLIAPSSADASKLAWFADVAHFTWWNCDIPWTDRRCFDVRVVDPAGAPVSGVPVRAEGTTYSGASTITSTAADGHACVDIVLGKEAKIVLGPASAPLVEPIPVTGSGLPGSCAGQGAACTPLVVTLPDPPVCIPGSSRPCAYSGPPATEGVGLCQAGKDYCNLSGSSWIGCEGEITPAAETCATLFDEDCDGLSNEEGPGCVCDPGSVVSCYTGPVDTLGVGLCEAGEQACKASGMGFSACMGEVLPAPEACEAKVDANCDGATGCGLHAWSKSFGDASWQYGKAVAIDSQGNVFVAGEFNGSVDFGGGPLVNTGSNDAFLVKFDASGKHVWSKQWSGVASSDSISVDGVIVDSAGNAYMTGSHMGATNLPGQPMGGGKPILFLIKVDPSGNVVWGNGGTGGSPTVGGIAVDDAGNVVMVGSMDATISFYYGPIDPSNGGYDVFVAKFDTSGLHVWTQVFGDASDQFGRGVAVNSAGDVFFTGRCQGAGCFDGPSAGGEDLFVAKLNASGALLWGKRFGDATDQQGTSIAVDDKGNALVLGMSQGAVDFGGGALAGAGGQDVVLAKLDPAGQHLWSKRFGIGGGQEGTSVAAFGAGSMVITGQFSGTADFGGGPITSVGSSNAFLAKLDASGQHIYSQRFGDVWAKSNGVAADSTGVAAITGYFGLAGLSFGGPPLPNNGSSADIFVAKFYP